MGTESKTRTVGASQEFTPAVFLLQKKSNHSNNIVTGDDAAQLRFLSEELGVEIERVDRITDDMLVGQSGRLLHVFAGHRIDMSPEMRGKTGFWSAEQITKGSAAINVIVKYAAALMGQAKLTREQLDIVGDQVIRNLKKIVSVNVAIWEASWLLTGEVKKLDHWPEPWEQPIRWVHPDMIVGKRLHVLYNKLVGYATWLGKGDSAAKALGVKPHELQKYKDLTLDPTKVHDTIKTLSQWKSGRWEETVCAGIICSIWQ
jgi:hypothetical protein